MRPLIIMRGRFIWTYCLITLLGFHQMKPVWAHPDPFSLAPYTKNQYSICTNPMGQIIASSFHSEIYHGAVEYNIYLPPCVDLNLPIRYPVIYLLNGQTFDHNQWVNLGILEVTDDLIRSNMIPPVIIVMPNDQDWRQPSESPFGNMILEELIPHIEATYPASSDKGSRAIGGVSRGASWALHIGLENWGLFSKIGAHSLPVFLSDEALIPKWISTIPAGEAPQIYIDTGNQDPEINHARRVERLLSDLHLPHEWYLFVGDHDETYWRSHLEKYIFWYACGWTVLYYN